MLVAVASTPRPPSPVLVLWIWQMPLFHQGSWPCLRSSVSQGVGLSSWPPRYPPVALRGDSQLFPQLEVAIPVRKESKRVQSNPTFLAENIGNSLLRIKAGCVQQNVFRHPLFSVSWKQTAWDNAMLNNVSYHGLLPEQMRFHHVGNLNIFRLWTSLPVKGNLKKKSENVIALNDMYSKWVNGWRKKKKRKLLWRNYI